jgi:translation initiation factor 1
MADGKTPFHNPFGALAGLGRGRPASDPEPAVIPAPVKREAVIARAVVRIERAGRGGKAVTVIEQLPLQPAQLDDWLKALKAGLGCGGTREGNALVLQGDQRQRVAALLTARGVKRVIGG